MILLALRATVECIPKSALMQSPWDLFVQAMHASMLSAPMRSAVSAQVMEAIAQTPAGCSRCTGLAPGLAGAAVSFAHLDIELQPIDLDGAESSAGH